MMRKRHIGRPATLYILFVLSESAFFEMKLFATEGGTGLPRYSALSHNPGAAPYSLTRPRQACAY